MSQFQPQPLPQPQPQLLPQQLLPQSQHELPQPTTHRPFLKSRTTTVRTFLLEDIRTDALLESELLLLSFATGIQDAAAWPDYACFASNQTGNALFLAIAAANLHHNAYSVPNIAVSLALFVAGALVFGQLGHALGPRRRVWLLASNVVQTALVFVALLVQTAGPVRRDGPAAMSVIACLAFSSGAQVAMSRGLGVPEITTAMATAAFVDVVVDPGLGRLRNRGRTRRVLFLMMLTAGCFVGAFAQRGVGSQFPLLLCAAGKAVVCVGVLFNRPVVRQEEEEDEEGEELKV
ncbi:hypothetical protein N7462_001622 [Penicillium macrosclerotiorum]|uniref:uncharacterized protein n=1 Tax=Penicillium macrosclerotiorum TaxID=303699 RepID=UPI0025476CA1|nr:uncharacterized protein N7462_001622 [Penicillium macrosclerotiorum]KAJ5692199.1 hypothetical protein N7462_001622 [Penicillium macrosclerotiorum]